MDINHRKQIRRMASSGNPSYLMVAQCHCGNSYAKDFPTEWRYINFGQYYVTLQYKQNSEERTSSSSSVCDGGDEYKRMISIIHGNLSSPLLLLSLVQVMLCSHLKNQLIKEIYGIKRRT